MVRTVRGAERQLPSIKAKHNRATAQEVVRVFSLIVLARSLPRDATCYMRKGRAGKNKGTTEKLRRALVWCWVD